MGNDEAMRNARVRRYATVVTVAMVILCNIVVLGGIWLSGINLEELVRPPDFFNPKSDVCLRLTWQRLSGAQDPVRLCSEWINLGDPSGRAHALDKDTRVRQGADGRYYLDQSVQPDYRLMGYVGFVGMVIVLGMLGRRYLVGRYRGRLEAAARLP